jgi:hypothetical protein
LLDDFEVYMGEFTAPSAQDLEPAAVPKCAQEGCKAHDLIIAIACLKGIEGSSGVLDSLLLNGVPPIGDVIPAVSKERVNLASEVMPGTGLRDSEGFISELEAVAIPTHERSHRLKCLTDTFNTVK